MIEFAQFGAYLLTMIVIWVIDEDANSRPARKAVEEVALNVQLVGRLVLAIVP